METKVHRKKNYVKAINYFKLLQEDQSYLHDYKTYLYENQS